MGLLLYKEPWIRFGDKAWSVSLSYQLMMETDQSIMIWGLVRGREVLEYGSLAQW